MNNLEKRRRQKIRDSYGGFDNLMGQTEKARIFAQDAPRFIDDLDKQFSKLTGLNKTDYCFLFFATALQTVRWILQEAVAQEPTDRKPHDDPQIKKETQKAENKFNDKHKGDEAVSGFYKDWKQIIADGVPYDITNGSKGALGKGLNGKNHRFHTLGHDPYLGWIFGTANIMTNTCTTVCNGSWNIIRGANNTPIFGKPTSVAEIFSDTYKSTMEDKVRLAAALCKQGIHLASDKYTIQGLPIPILSTIFPALAERLYTGGYDYLDLKCDLGVIAKQATYASLINFIIAIIHDFFYDSKEFPEHKLYEVKTRKILLYSNLIASASNLIYVGVTTALGKPDSWKKIDFGGIAVTIYRLFSDIDFIYRVRREFITENFARKLDETISQSSVQNNIENIKAEDFLAISKFVTEEREKIMSSTKENKLIETFKSVCPFWGYNVGRANGFKDGMKEASSKYEQILNELRKQMGQYNRDVFGKNSCFICPDGWDEAYWQKCLICFLDEAPEDLSARDIFFAFTKAFREKMEKEHLTTIKCCPLTYIQLELIQSVVSIKLNDLRELSIDSLQITVDFFDLFISLKNEKNHSKLARKIDKLRNEIKAILSHISACNILALGRTRVGKSSMLNYLLGSNVFAAGPGKPLTQQFEKKEGVVNNVNIRVFDSKGLECDSEGYSFDQYKTDLNKFKQSHDVFQSPHDWIHAAVYCMPKGFEPVDFKIIKELIKDKFYVAVALTKMDSCTPDEREMLKDSIIAGVPGLKKENIAAICSVYDNTRAGKVEPFGREDLIKAILIGFRDVVIDRVPTRCIYLLEKAVDDLCEEIKKEIDSRKMALILNNKDIEWFKERMKCHQKNFTEKTIPAIINKEIEAVITSCSKMIFTYYPDGAENIDSPIINVLTEVFGVGLAAALSKELAFKIGVNVGGKFIAKASASYVAASFSLAIPIINIITTFVAAGFLGYDLLTKNEKLKKEFCSVVNKFNEKIKHDLIELETPIRDNLRKSFDMC